MTTTPTTNDFRWRKSRYAFATFFFFSLLAACFILRVVLLVKFGMRNQPSAGTVAQLLLLGLQQDVLVALVVLLPLLFWLWIIGDTRFGRTWHRVLFIAGFFLFWTVQSFLHFTEYYFFEEFKSRFNTVAVDYLLYPAEVVGNIRDSYPLFTVVAICVLLGVAWVVVAFRSFRQMWLQPTSGGSRFLCFAGGAALCLAAWVGSHWSSTHAWNFTGLNLKSVHAWFLSSLQDTRFSSDRTLNEIAANGSISFFAAALTHNLDYAAYYRTIPRDEAYARVRKLLSSPAAEFVGDDFSIRRKMKGDPRRPRLNVVLLLEESLGSEFWGCLGRTNTLTPHMDKLATEEGLLFDNIYACGNRTVRGFEGVFSSFPPLPGDSIVKRDRSENVESIARVLKRDGYSTVFLYGGRAVFDGMGAYASNNGWDRFLEHNPPFKGSILHTLFAGFLSLFSERRNPVFHDDFPKATFSTIWGVCDEEVFAQAILEFRKLNEAGKPFLGTVLTVSNHKPYTFPEGRIPDDGKKPNRQKAVRYTDWSLGKFFEKAKDEGFWTNTIFVVVADHGARVYGQQQIPIRSFEIPVVILGPAVVKQPRRIGTLGSSLDVAPTVLGLIGRPYETMFFGRDLLQESPQEARALLNHNRDIGMFAQDRMVVLGLQKTAMFYAGDPRKIDLKAPESPTPEFTELEKNATAIYQVADDLYMNRLYRIDGRMEGTTPTNAVPTVEIPGALIITGSTNRSRP